MLNRCLDDAIPDAVTEFGFQRDAKPSVLQIAVKSMGRIKPVHLVLERSPGPEKDNVFA